jgi:thiol-disulfide isomerase/thioredoxin
MKIPQTLLVVVIFLAALLSCKAQDTSASATLATADVTAADGVVDMTTEESGLDLDSGEEIPINANITAAKESPVQTGPFIDLLGPTLLSLQMVDDKSAQLVSHYTNEALAGKKVVGLYFSADWCGPCRKFTPELLAFYNKMNARKGRTNEFEIVWISRCRDFNSFGQYFAHMNWLAMQPEDAQGALGQMLSNKYKVKGIPSLVLLDEIGNVITTDARNKLPLDKGGIGFPWRNPIATLYMTIIPKSLRLMVKGKITPVKEKLLSKVKSVIGELNPLKAKK